MAGGRNFCDTISISMVEKEVIVEVDEKILNGPGQRSYLVADILVDGKVYQRAAFGRETSPEYISRFFYNLGCSIKYDEYGGLRERESQNKGGLYIEASYVVPGLKNRTSGCLR